MLRRGDVFAGFVIERELGRGGMGAVYAARHPRLPKLLALKLLHRELFGDKETRGRFEREADLVAQLDHPNIITVHDRGIEDNHLWISMQYVDGVDTAAIPVNAMPVARAMQILHQTAGALDYAHTQGVLHRDVKPANILLSRSAGAGPGFTERVLLTDFGIAKLLADSGRLTRTGTLVATLAYASPEQLIAAPVDYRADQYSLACTLFRMLTGYGPYDAPNIAAIMWGHVQSPPPSLRAARPDLPAGLDTVLAKAMAKDPDHRFRTCCEFAEAALEAWRKPEQPRTIHRPPQPDRRPPNRPTEQPLRSSSLRAVADRVHGSLLGGAVGDALGAPIENLLLVDIRQRYGPNGVTGDRFEGKISEETQLALFTMEALIKGSVRARAKGSGGATLGMMQQGFLVWLRGQGVEIPEQETELHSRLAVHPALVARRGNGLAVISALQKAGARGKPFAPLGTRTEPVNDSKGCAALARSAPCGFGYLLDRTGLAVEIVFELGCDAAALTHGNPSGWLPAGTLAIIVYELVRGTDLRAAIDRARTELRKYERHEETSKALDAAVRLADRVGARIPRPEDTEALGPGWIGPEALAIAVYAALAAQTVGGTPEQMVRNGILLAVNHSGDSDATGAICGSILGACFGASAIPPAWRAVDVHTVVEELAIDYCTEFGPNPPSGEYGGPSPDWFARHMS
ncbi:ADP-ribosylglycohydrolase family protein [Nocardia sp. XZ_19_385]|uniref:ADP-ribosylglycohydrolase family protein n=1 Tax=Nocardia sp. XZ_19_385 TaxID=2769488 RepID=UPI001E478DD4|nr:ADP-ribosylglycohydrolase family protein [Nocardia sp. XZ_19_385]